MFATQPERRIYQATISLSEDVAKRLPILPDDDLTYQRILLSYFDKSYTSFRAASELLAKGYGADAQIVTRSIFEIMLHVMFLMEGDGVPEDAEPKNYSTDHPYALKKAVYGTLEQRRKAFFEHIRYTQNEYLDKLDEVINDKKLVLDPARTQGLDALKTMRERLSNFIHIGEVKEAGANFAKRWRGANLNSWTGLGVERLARLLAARKQGTHKFWKEETYLGHKLMYLCFSWYKDYSIFVHSLGQFVYSYKRANPKQYGKPFKMANDLQVLKAAATCLYIVMWVLVAEFGISDEKSEKLLNDFLIAMESKE